MANLIYNGHAKPLLGWLAARPWHFLTAFRLARGTPTWALYVTVVQAQMRFHSRIKEARGSSMDYQALEAWVRFSPACFTISRFWIGQYLLQSARGCIQTSNLHPTGFTNCAVLSTCYSPRR